MKKEPVAPIAPPLPNDLGAERAVLGSILLDNAIAPEVYSLVSAGEFLLTSHQKIFRAMQALSLADRPIDQVTLLDQLGPENEEIARMDVLGQTVAGLPKSRNFAQYAKIVREKALLRRLIYFTEGLQKEAMNGGGGRGAKLLLERSVRELLTMLSTGQASGMPVSWKESAYAALEGIGKAIDTPESVMRINFGIPTLDDYTSGLRRKDLVLIVGQTSHGKTLLAMQAATNADSAGYRGLIFSAEMSKEAVVSRELAHTAGIPLWYLRRPEKAPDGRDMMRRLTNALMKESERNLLLVDQDVRQERVWALAEMVHRTSGLDFVVVDYDQLVIRAGLRSREDEFASQARFVNQALEFAKRLDICFILVCQPRKVSEDVARGKANPRIEEIYGSSAVANTAHHVLWVVREFFQKGMKREYERKAKIYILKARNDRAGSVEIDFDPKQVKFGDKLPEENSENAKPRRQRHFDGTE
jgi:replicative DNA helicase